MWPSPVFWPGEFHWLYSPWGCKESDTNKWLSLASVWNECNCAVVWTFFGIAWYDLTQIPYNCTVEVRNRSAWWTMDGGWWHCTGDRDQDHPHGKEMQKGKMVVWGGFTKIYEKKRSVKQRRKGKIYLFEHRVPKSSKETSLSQWSMQRNRGKQQNGKD